MCHYKCDSVGRMYDKLLLKNVTDISSTKVDDQ